jgi:hypothetical protein
MSKPKSKVLGLLLGATMGLVGFASASAPAMANDPVGDTRFYLLCLQKLMSNAADRVEVCNPVLQDFKLRSDDVGPPPPKDNPPPVDECDVRPVAFVLAAYNHDPCEEDPCDDYQRASYTLAGYNHGCYEPCGPSPAAWGWEYGTDDVWLLQAANRGGPSMFDQFNKNKNKFQAPKNNKNKFQQPKNNKNNKFHKPDNNKKKGKKGGKKGGNWGGHCNTTSGPLNAPGLVLLNV